MATQLSLRIWRDSSAAQWMASSIDALYNEFCLVANFIVDPLQSVDLLPVSQPEGLPQQVIECLKRRKRKRKPAEDAAPAPEV